MPTMLFTAKQYNNTKNIKIKKAIVIIIRLTMIITEVFNTEVFLPKHNNTHTEIYHSVYRTNFKTTQSQ